jgi:hypothetical protein
MNVEKVIVVVPTIRPDKIEKFLEEWGFRCRVLVVFDGKEPILRKINPIDTWRAKFGDEEYKLEEIMGDYYKDLISNFSAGVRNLGFAYIAKHMPEVEYIITLDDDVKPQGDTLDDHIKALEMRMPIRWMRVGNHFTRGFPYCVRREAEVVLSHGVWTGVHDFDAPTQLILGNPGMDFYRGPVPKGVLFPMSSMNLAFKRKMLPYMYMAPREHRVDRFEDIFCGIDAKREIDEQGWAAVTGYSRVFHEKASNVFNNLEKESRGLLLNEGYWQGVEDDPYFKIYTERKKRWQEFVS